VCLGAMSRWGISVGAFSLAQRGTPPLHFSIDTG
jgi:hypothetical protein